MTTLHIFNGDSTFESFKMNSIPGDTIVWREVLVEGPVKYQLRTKEFWNVRSEYFSRVYNIKFDEYHQKSIKPWESIHFGEFTEIVLWFEYDLFCRINFFAVLAMLHQKKFEGTISQLNLHAFQKGNTFLGLAEIDPSLYENIFQGRTALSYEQIAWADKLWSIYCEQYDNDKLASFVNDSPGIFEHLEEFIKSLAKLEKDATYALDNIDRYILNMLYQQGPKSAVEIIRQLFKAFPDLGFGDTQYLNRIKILEPKLQLVNEKFELNERGKAVSDEMF